MDSMKILVLEACGLSLSYLGCYGSEWVATPNLDRIAAEGIVFDWHFVDQPELLPSTPLPKRSVGTGCYALEAAIGAPMQPHVTRCELLPSFADDVLKAMETNDAWLWIEGPSLLPPWIREDDLLGMYFDEDDLEDRLTPWTDPPFEVADLDEAEVLELQNTYAAVVTLFDAQLEVIVNHLDDDTLLCVTARSGLPLAEHGMIGTPQPRLHDELVHVPLLVRLPNRPSRLAPLPGREPENAGLRIAALTQPVDLLPTILEALGQSIPPTHGRSLWPLIRGEVDSIRPYAFAHLQAGGEESRLIRTPTWALHVDPSGARAAQVYVKPEDRREVNDLGQQQIEAAEQMAATMRAFMDAIRRPGPLTYPSINVDSTAESR